MIISHYLLGNRDYVFSSTYVCLSFCPSLSNSTQKVIKGLQSPGLDGITVEFYEHFWSLRGGLLVDVVNDCFENGILPNSEQSDALSLIFQKDDTEDISNYMPISLTNVDYSILALHWLEECKASLTQF